MPRIGILVGLRPCSDRRGRRPGLVHRGRPRRSTEAGEAVRRRRLQGAAELRHRHLHLAEGVHPHGQQPHPRRRSDLRVHVYDGRAFHAKVVVPGAGPRSRASSRSEEEVDFLPHYDFAAAAKQPMAEAGDWVLAISNCFQMATRDEPMSVQRGVIAVGDRAARPARRLRCALRTATSISSTPSPTTRARPAAPSSIARASCSASSAGSCKNNLTDTWINYADPDPGEDGVPGRETTKTVIDVRRRIRGQGDRRAQYKPTSRRRSTRCRRLHRHRAGAERGEATPPYIDEVVPGSPAAKAGLRPDDLIVYVDGELVPTIKHSRDLVKYVTPGNELSLEVQPRRPSCTATSSRSPSRRRRRPAADERHFSPQSHTGHKT